MVPCAPARFASAPGHRWRVSPRRRPALRFESFHRSYPAHRRRCRRICWAHDRALPLVRDPACRAFRVGRDVSRVRRARTAGTSELGRWPGRASALEQGREW